MKNNLSLIVAMDLNRTIGYKGELPWNIPEDLALFKEITTNNIIIMGRKTFDSIKRPLPNRINIVLSNQKSPSKDNLYFFTNINEIFDFIHNYFKDKKVFIIGGESIYNLFIDYVEEFHISVINKNYIGDTFFPKINLKNFSVHKHREFKEFTYTHYIKNYK